MAKYKVGDKVLIKKQYDPGKEYWDYTAGFMPDMIEEFGGKILTIEKIEHNGLYPYYQCSGNTWHWSEDMFDEVSDEL